MEQEFKSWMKKRHDRGEIKEFDYLPNASRLNEWQISILVIECTFGEVERFHVQITKGLDIKNLILNQFELEQMVKSDLATIKNHFRK